MWDVVTEHFSAFLEQLVNLEIIELEKIQFLTSNDYKTIFSHPKLKKAKIDYSAQLENCLQCEVLEELIIHGDDESYNLQNIVEKFPNLKILRLTQLYDVPHISLTCVSTSLQNLQILEIHHCQDAWLQDTRIPTLKELILTQCGDLSIQGFRMLCSNNSQLEVLDIENNYNMNDECVKLLAFNLKKLRKLRISGEREI